MINKLGGNLNFKGRVYIGGNTPEGKMDVAKTIAKFYSVSDRDKIIANLNGIKDTLVKKTPNSDDYDINFRYGKRKDDAAISLELGIAKNGKSIANCCVQPRDINPKRPFLTQFDEEDLTRAIDCVSNEVNGTINRHLSIQNAQVPMEEQVSSIFNRLA